MRRFRNVKIAARLELIAVQMIPAPELLHCDVETIGDGNQSVTMFNPVLSKPGCISD
jgi:hypothetical protein